MRDSNMCFNKPLTWGHSVFMHPQLTLASMHVSLKITDFDVESSSMKKSLQRKNTRMEQTCLVLRTKDTIAVKFAHYA